jgi:hypothetical protein
MRRAEQQKKEAQERRAILATPAYAKYENICNQTKKFESVNSEVLKEQERKRKGKRREKREN